MAQGKWARSGKSDGGAAKVPWRADQSYERVTALADVGRSQLFEPALPVQEHPRLSAPDLRGLRPRALVLGHRHYPHAVLVSAMGDDVHRGATVAEGPRPRAGDGRGRRRLARLEAPGRRLIARRRWRGREEAGKVGIILAAA